MRWVDLKHPVNRGVLKSMQKGKRVIAPPSSAKDPYAGCGSHPEIVERVWDELGSVVPRDCRCLLYGTPALVHDRSGVVLAVSYGTQYGLRLPPGAIPKARLAKAWSTTIWSLGGSMNIREEFGPDWVFGRWRPREAQWLKAVYQQFSPDDSERTAAE